MALDDQRFKDHCLIIVGNGGKADEVLAKRRLAAGGRLAHFLTRPDDPRVTFSASADGLEYDFFTWQPPKGTMGISSFARKLQGKPRTFWTKTGPPGFQKAFFWVVLGKLVPLEDPLAAKGDSSRPVSTGLCS